MLTDTFKARVREAVTTLERLEALLDRADDRPGMLLARAAVEVDKAANRLDGVVEKLKAARPDATGTPAK
jgi:hypothetical protein